MHKLLQTQELYYCLNLRVKDKNHNNIIGVAFCSVLFYGSDDGDGHHGPPLATVTAQAKTFPIIIVTSLEPFSGTSDVQRFSNPVVVN